MSHVSRMITDCVLRNPPRPHSHPAAQAHYQADHVPPLAVLHIPLSGEYPSIQSNMIQMVGLCYNADCCQVGQTFLHFQWDILLLEAGALAVILSPLWPGNQRASLPQDRVNMFLVRWAPSSVYNDARVGSCVRVCSFDL